MAGNPLPTRSGVLEELAGEGPWFWFGVLALSLPWLRIAVGPVAVYPGQLAFSLLLAFSLWRKGGLGLRPPGPLLALGVYVAGLAAWRGQWAVALVTLGVLALHSLWGTAAYCLAYADRSDTTLSDALVLLLGGMLGTGLVAWGAQAAAPALCRALPCAEDGPWPYAFQGGAASPAQFLLFLVCLLPPLGDLLLRVTRSGRIDRGGRLLLAMAGAAAVAVLAGATLWRLLVLALGLVLLHQALAPAGRQPVWRLVRGPAAFLAFSAVMLYGLVPGYLSGLSSERGGGPLVRIALEEAAPRRLSSEQGTALALRVVNLGWNALGPDDGRPVRVGVRVLITPDSGKARIYTGEAVPLPGTLAPGEARTLRLVVRLPPWLREGYLTWRAEDGRGRPIALARSSDPGFRFTNLGYRRLEQDSDNRLSALLRRALDYQAQTKPVEPPQPDPNGTFMMMGDVVDTLFFSPLWGEPGPRPEHPYPFGLARPAFIQLLHEYGLIGLALAALFLWRLRVRALDVARADARSGGGLGWRLVPLSLALLFVMGWFSPVLGTYHGLWALFLLAGWVEGRHARLFPRRIARSRAGAFAGGRQRRGRGLPGFPRRRG
jgi:hypothetical protein